MPSLPNILTPNELLGSTGILDQVYYTSAGHLVCFLFDRCGVETVNRVLPFPAAASLEPEEVVVGGALTHIR